MEQSEAPRIFASLWRYRVTSAVIVIVAVVLAGLLGLVSGGKATVTARIALETPSSLVLTGTNAATEPTFVRYVSQRAIFATSNRVLTEAAATVGGGTTADDLQSTVTAKATTAGEAIVVTATASTPSRAVTIANAVTQAYIDQSRTDVDAARDKALATIAVSRDALVKAGAGRTSAPVVALDEQVSQIELDASQFGGGVSFVNNATTAAATKSGVSVIELALGFVLGLIIAGTVAWLRADNDRRIDNFDELSDILDAPMLGSVSHVEADRRGDLLALDKAPQLAFIPAITGIQARFGRGVLFVSSAGAGQGRTTAAFNIAAGLARTSAKVILVDASLETATLARFSGSSAEGFTNVIDGTVQLAAAIRSLRLDDEHVLDLLPAGAGGASGPSTSVSRSAAIERVILELRDSYDLVIIDTDPGIATAESTAVARYSDGALIVIRRGSRTRDLVHFMARLRLFDIRAIGYIFNGSAEFHRHRAGDDQQRSVPEPVLSSAEPTTSGTSRT